MNINNEVLCKLSFLKDGKILVEDAQGKEIGPLEGPFPMKTGLIYDIEQPICSMVVSGSGRYKIIKIGDMIFKIPID